jgi:hypothetical protein
MCLRFVVKDPKSFRSFSAIHEHEGFVEEGLW